MNHLLSSPFHTVHQNLALEEYLIDHLPPGHGALLFYTNTPAVVIGRNQNPWQEVDLALLNEHDIQLARRTSGGGAVYHDPGNLNFCFIADRGDFNLDKHYQLIINALSALGIVATLSDRKDLRVNDRKFSGNAFRYFRTKALQHGTLLVNTDLDRLNRVLRSPLTIHTSRAVPSIRSHVTNLSEHHTGLTIKRLTDTLADAYTAHMGPTNRTKITALLPDTQDLAPYRTRHQSLEWLFGETPAFAYTANHPATKHLNEHIHTVNDDDLPALFAENVRTELTNLPHLRELLTQLPTSQPGIPQR